MAEMADPFNIGIPPKKLNDQELARAIRMDAAAEIEAINLYEAHIAATDNENAKRILAHVAHEEKDHLTLFLDLLNQLDPDQITATEEAREEFPLIEAGLPVDEEPQAPAPMPPSFTVGSLIEKNQTP